MGKSPLKARFISAVFLLAALLFFFGLAAFSRDLAYEDAFSQQNLIRFHVLANSNLPKDQDLKLLVRDAVITETKSLFLDTEGKKQAYELLSAKQNLIRDLAQEVVYSQGFDYPVQVSIGYFPFPERQYGSLALPEGWYDAVRIEIGEGKGDNWWCVLFPPLCFSEDPAESNLVSIDHGSSNNHFALRWKLWDNFTQTQYAKALQKWWQASAAGYSVIVD